MFSRLRGKIRIVYEIPRLEPSTAAEWRLVQLQDRVTQAERIIRARLQERAGDADVLLDLLVALGLAPAADDEVPVIPGRTT